MLKDSRIEFARVISEVEEEDDLMLKNGNDPKTICESIAENLATLVNSFYNNNNDFEMQV